MLTDKRVTETCNKIASMIHEKNPNMTKKQCWEMAKGLYIKSMNAMLEGAEYKRSLQEKGMQYA